MPAPPSPPPPGLVEAHWGNPLVLSRRVHLHTGESFSVSHSVELDGRTFPVERTVIEMIGPGTFMLRSHVVGADEYEALAAELGWLEPKGDADDD